MEMKMWIEIRVEMKIFLCFLWEHNHDFGHCYGI